MDGGATCTEKKRTGRSSTCREKMTACGGRSRDETDAAGRSRSPVDNEDGDWYPIQYFSDCWIISRGVH